MDVAAIEVSGIQTITAWSRAIPSGIIGARILFRYTDPEWDNLVKNVVIRHGGATRTILDATDVVEIPRELVAVPSSQPIWVGVYGVAPDGASAIPTLWTQIGVIRNASDPSRDPTSDPNLPIWAQLLLRIKALEDAEYVPGNSYVLPIAGAELGGVKSGGNVVINEDGTMAAPVPDLTGYVKSVNGVSPDETGNVEITIPDSGGNADYVGVEPADDDIPKVFFGGALQQTKDEKVVSFRYISKTEDISGYAEIKAQGNSSMSYPKKNQTVKLFKDADCTEKLKVDFKGWGKQNKHVYKANWIDLTHARNVVSARLWADVVKSRSNYAELPELLKTSPNQGAVDGFPVKVYADGVYQGRYTLNIPKDKWAFNMDDSLDNHCVLCGENYVSGCFRASANINGSDWSDEIHDSVPASIKTRWNEVISFVMNSTDEEFRANLGNYFYVDSLIDYHLFGLASCGLDAYGKNQLYMTYDGQKWLASMYDMDSTWGLYWNGSKFVASDYSRESYEDFVAGNGNLLYIRLEQCFGEELQARWAELKNGALSMTNIINRFERFTDIAPLDLVKEDYASTTGNSAYTGIPSQLTNNIQQIRSFALARLAWTDEYVSALTGESGGETEKTLTSISATYSGGDVAVGTAVSDLKGIVVTAHYSDGSTETVTGYTLSGEIAEGDNTVTVAFGGKTATFTVVGTAEDNDDDGIDYTLNPLENVTYHPGYVYDKTTGDMVENANDGCSSKFTLQDCFYSVQTTSVSPNGLVMWDETGKYVGQAPFGAGFIFKPLPGYTYAMRMYPKSDNPGISIMPVDNRANISTPVTIDMTTGWIADSAGAKKSIADVCPTGGLTITNVHSLDGNCLFAVGKNLTISSGLNVPSAAIWDGTMLRSHNSTTAEGAAAYYAEHCPTLTING